MDAVLSIKIKVEAERAKAQLESVQQATKDIGQEVGKTPGVFKRFGSALARSGTDITNWGKNLQWSGQQLTYNFTLPLVAAGAAAVKWGLDNERAMTDVRKVYGDASMSAKELAEDLGHLETSFRLLSDRYGVQQSEVIKIGGVWAQAGRRGTELARATQLTIEAMIVGNMEQEKATKGLISVQAAYQLSIQETRDALAQMNAIENSTTISIGELIEVITRAGGSARSAGIEINELAAMAAVLVPSAGTATQAGTALRTMISRLMQPTTESTNLLRELGIEIDQVSWLSKNGMERIMTVAEGFDTLTQSQKAIASSVIASRWQIDRFDRLMGDVVRSSGVFATAMKASDDAIKDNAGNVGYLSDYVRELNTYLASTPQKLKIFTTQLQNAMVDAIAPLLPALVGVMHQFSRLAKWFGDLDPRIQQLVMGFLLLLAVVGPIIRYVGAVGVLFGNLIQTATWLGGSISALATKLFGIGVASKVAGTETAAAVKGPGILARAYTSLADHFGTVSKWMMVQASAFAGGVAGIFSQAWKGMVWAFQPATDAIAALTGAMWGRIKAFTAAGLTIVKGMMSSLPRFWAVVTTLIKGIWVGMQAAWVKIQATFSAGLPAVGTALMSGWKAIGGGLAKLWSGTMTVMSRLTVVAGSLIKAVFTGIQTFVGFVSTGMVTIWTSAMTTMAAVATSPWTLLVLAVALAAYAFREQISAAVNYVITKFQELGPGVIGVFRSLVQIVKRFALQVYEWLSYINPFARHSPSLVEQVNAGVSTIMDQYSRLSGVGRIVKAAADAHAHFNEVTKGASDRLNAARLGQKREEIIAIEPGAAGAVDGMITNIRRLTTAQRAVGMELAKQVPVTAKWDATLRQANQQLKAQEDVLKLLRGEADLYRSRIDELNDSIGTLASTPLEGMGAMSDAIFDNEMAQKRLRLEIMRMEDAYGGLDDSRRKLAMLAGEIEKLRGTQTELRRAGAGSDVTDFYDQQIAELEAQQRAITQGVDSGGINQLQEELKQLERQGQILDLENSLQFDPLTREIDKVVNSMEEMPFNEIISSITAQREEVKELEVVWGRMDQAVKSQQRVVDEYTLARDKIQVVYDRENEKLRELESAYSDIGTQIRNMESALNGFAQTASAASSSALKGAKSALAGMGGLGSADMFKAAGAADFDIPTGSLGADDISLEEWNKEMEAELAEAMKELGGIDLFGPFKDMWNEAWKWIKDRVGPVVKPVIDAVSGFLDTIKLPSLNLGNIFGGGDGIDFSWLTGPLSSVFEWVGMMAGYIGGFFADIWPAVSGFLDAVIEGIQVFASKVWTELEPFGETFSRIFSLVMKVLGAFGRGIGGVAKVFGVVVAAVGIGLGKIWSLFVQYVLPILTEIVVPVFSAIGDVVAWAINFIRNTIDFFLDLLEGDWGSAFGRISDIVSTTFKTIWNILTAAFSAISGVVRKSIDVIVGIWEWLYDVLVGNSIIPDMVDAILAVFRFLWGAVEPIFSAIAAIITFIWENVVQPAFVAIGWYIENIVIPALEWLSERAEEIFPLISDAIDIAWTIIKFVFNAIKWYVENVLIPVWESIWSTVKTVFEAAQKIIDVAWGIIKAVFNAIKGFIDNTLRPAFTTLRDTVSTVWTTIQTAISGAWTSIKSVFTTIKNFLNDTLGAAFRTLRTTVTTAWDKIKESTDTVFGGIKKIMGGGIEGGIKVINALIRGLNKVSDVLPGVSWKISEIPIPKYAAGGAMPVDRITPTATKVGSGFVTNRPRAIVGEGSPLHDEFVVPTDPRYRSRALSLWQQLGSRIGAFDSPGYARGGNLGAAGAYTASGVPMMFLGGVIDKIPSPGDVVGAISSGVEWVGGQIRKGVVMAAFAPFNVMADNLLKLVSWKQVGEVAKRVKDDIYTWVKGADDGINEKLEEEEKATANVPARAGVNMNLNPDFLRRYAGYNKELGNPFTVVSGLRTRAQQEALYAKYLAGTGNLAARPGTSRHESGYALDHAPGTRFAKRYMDMARKWGLHYPVRSPQAEDWHVEPIKRMFEGGLIEEIENANLAIMQAALGGGSFGPVVEGIRALGPKGITASLANGGRIAHRPGGALLQVAEGQYDEQVQILPLKGEGDGKSTNVYIGKVEFPNIKDPDDAKKFIDNLRDITED